jgi:hypothetical protein
MGPLKYKIIDNFLEESLFKEIQETMFSTKLMPWYYHDHQTKEGKDGSYFLHLFFKDDLIVSNYFLPFIVPIFKKLEGKYLLEARANLTIKTEITNNSDWHTDRSFVCYTSIFYINTNNGSTELCMGDPKNKDEMIKINCKENRMLIFDSQLKHRAVGQTDVDRRVVINFNYK